MKPKSRTYRTDIDPGDIIEFSGLEFLVIENWGQIGKVKELPGGPIIERFAWREAKVISKRNPTKETMKLSELLKKAQRIMEQFGDLDVQIVMITAPDDPEAVYLGDLTRLEVEERVTLNLISEERALGHSCQACGEKAPLLKRVGNRQLCEVCWSEE